VVDLRLFCNEGVTREEEEGVTREESVTREGEESVTRDGEESVTRDGEESVTKDGNEISVTRDDDDERSVTRDGESSVTEKRDRQGDFWEFSPLDSWLFGEWFPEGVTIAKPRREDLEELPSSTTVDGTCSWWLSAIISLAVFLRERVLTLVDFAVFTMVARDVILD
jgi:hypothetical protein